MLNYAVEDFLGFSFNGYHSSNFGIVRTSNSNRYDKSLSSAFQDAFFQGQNNTDNYYFDTYYQNGQIQINFAFDQLTEVELKKLQKWLGYQGICDLFFDETPYKAHSVKREKPVELSLICYDKGEDRIYSGTGILNLTYYYSFSHGLIQDKQTALFEQVPVDMGKIGYVENTSRSAFDKQYLSQNNFTIITLLTEDGDQIIDNPYQYEEEDIDWFGTNEVTSEVSVYNTDKYYKNIDQWIDSAELPDRTTIKKDGDNWRLTIHNTGDVDIPLKIVVPFLQNPKEDTVLRISLLTQQDDEFEKIVVTIPKNLVIKKDKYLLIDTYNCIIYGVDENIQKTGNLYNFLISDGDFFEAPRGTSILESTVELLKVDYDYLYLS